MASAQDLGRVGVCFALVLAGLILAAAAYAAFDFWLFTSLPGKPAFATKQFFIPPGTGSMGVASLLEANEVVRDARKFLLLAWLRSSLHRFQAGEYAFQTTLTPDQVLDMIVHGKVVIYTATLPEGSTIRDVAKVFEQAGLVAAPEVVRLASGEGLAKSLGLPAQSLEGYLFPDTYQFKKPADAALVLKTMVHEFWAHFPPEWRARAADLGLSVHQVVIMASIVEKEAVVDSERPVIAGVFYNRLRANMPLESDPTAVYDLPDFSGPVTVAHLGRQSPYNTYKIKGLPPGPICNPGAPSLKAALFPEKVPYYYFVSNNDGTHQFSETREEHNRAVSRYRQQKQQQKAAIEAGASGVKDSPQDPAGPGAGAGEGER